MTFYISGATKHGVELQHNILIINLKFLRFLNFKNKIVMSIVNEIIFY